MFRISDGDVKNFPHPDEDWQAFIALVKSKNIAQGQVWDPKTKSLKDWINVRMLQEKYGSTSSATCTVC